MRQYICFQVGEARYALPLGPVVQVLRFENVTPVPMAPPFVEGILNLGGEVVPVVSLRSRFGLERGEPTRGNRVLVVERAGVKHGLLVDGVKGILELEDSSILSAGQPLLGLKAELVAPGVHMPTVDAAAAAMDVARWSSSMRWIISGSV